MEGQAVDFAGARAHRRSWDGFFEISDNNEDLNSILGYDDHDAYGTETKACKQQKMGYLAGALSVSVGEKADLSTGVYGSVELS